MTKFDFETIIDRSKSHARSLEAIPFEDIDYKEGFSKIPMWVADMSFPTAPSVIEEIQKRLEHPIFGYFVTPDEYFDSIINWHKTRNGVDIERENIAYENGVLGGVVSIAKVLASPGQNILVHAPSYVGFIKALTANGYHPVFSNLYLDEENVWRMDYEDMEKKIQENNIQTAIFCSPHNPSGRVWEREEIEKAYEIFKRNDVYVIADEVWSDLILDDNVHIPTWSINEDAKMRTITTYAPSKTFNIAGLIGAYHLVFNPYLRKRIEFELEKSAYNRQNVLSCAGIIGAYKDQGAAYVDELRKVLSKNKDYAYDFINKNFKGVKLSKPQGTYVIYVSTKEWEEAHKKTHDQVLRRGVEHGVIWQDGRPFMVDHTIRINLALPHDLLVEAFDRLDKYVFNGDW
ncbi:MAG: aminotransferase class I/II-fold pyridoxal phosphate-dependent enzyme [Bacillota bacterium]|nr:aminotransferase class I/II-fold pyridoxal phosphate-dependent enzyme [Bacillota bacterium]